jgi:hypothetical protein
MEGGKELQPHGSHDLVGLRDRMDGLDPDHPRVARRVRVTTKNARGGYYMIEGKRWKRRVVGMVMARLGELGLSELPDRRARRGRQWKLRTVLATVIVGLAGGCRTLRGLELHSTLLPRCVRRRIGLKRRLPDTTARNVLVGMTLTALRGLIHQQVRAARRRKQLTPVGLPCGVVSVDGRGTSTPHADDHYAQRQSRDGGMCGIVRTVTCSLVSSRARVCLDAYPIPAKTNEMGVFSEVFDELERVYGQHGLYEIVAADAGNCSLANATRVNAADKGYVFQVKADSQPTLATEMQRVLADDLVPDFTDEERIGGATVTREIWLSKEMADYGGWTHLRTVVRVRRTVVRDDGTTTTGNRWFVSNVPYRRFTPEEWLTVIRRRWAVENENHNTWDRIMREDEHRWILEPVGMLAVILLRRVAYNMLTLFRTVTQRSEEHRAVPWRELIMGLYAALISATEELLTGLRPRRAAVFEV